MSGSTYFSTQKSRYAFWSLVYMGFLAAGFPRALPVEEAAEDATAACRCCVDLRLRVFLVAASTCCLRLYSSIENESDVLPTEDADARERDDSVEDLREVILSVCLHAGERESVQ